MRNKLAGVLAIIGAAIAVAGVIVGSVALQQNDQTCGSVFSPAPIPGFSLLATWTTTLCNQALAAQAGLTWTLIIAGAVILIGSVFGFKKTQSQQAHPDPDRPASVQAS